MKKFSIYFILTILIFSTFFNALCSATQILENSTVVETSEEKPDINSVPISSDCILMVEKDTGDILYEKNAYEKMYPASTAKILTAILVLENCDLDEIATVSSVAVRAVPATYATSALEIR